MAVRLSYVKHVVTTVKHMAYMTKSYNGKFSKRLLHVYTAGIYGFEIWQTVNSIYKTINKLAVNSSVIVG